MAAALASITSASFSADDKLKVTLGGSIDTQVGKTSERANNKYVGGAGTGALKMKRAIVNDTKLTIKAEGKADFFKYGANITLNTDVTNPKFQAVDDTVMIANQTSVYVESKLGKVVAGSAPGAYDSLAVSAVQVAHGAGGAASGEARYWTNKNRNSDFIRSGSGYSTSSSYKDNSFIKSAAKITYYTPSFKGFKVGVTFIPDLKKSGSVASTHTVPAVSSASAFDTNTYGAAASLDFKNVVSGGLRYDGKIKDVKVDAALLAETGKTKKSGSDTSVLEFRKLTFLEGGLKLEYKDFSIAGSVGKLGRSGLDKTSMIKSSSYFSLGAGYEWNKLGMSVTYFKSKKGAKGFTSAGADSSATTATYKHNIQRNLAFGMDYKLAEGLMPYLEYTSFKQTYANNISTTVLAKNNKGSVILAGMKLKF